MKKALLIGQTMLGSIMIAAAQITIGGGSVTGTVGGVPVSVGVGGAGGVVAGAGQVNGGPLLQLLALAQTIVARLVPFAIGVAVLAFFFFLIKYIIMGDSADKKKENLAGMGYALIALFVMVSVWGIIGFAGSLLGIGQGGSVPVPGIPIPQ